MKLKDKAKPFVKRKSVIWILIAIGFCAIEFPGIIFVRDRIYPKIFGIPFLYSYVLCCWAYMCCVLFYAYKTKWGKEPFIKGKEYDRNK